MILGLARHLGMTLWGIARAARQAGDKSFPYRRVALATMQWLLPAGQLKNRLLFSLTSLVFHVAIILVPIFLAGHIALWERGLGLSWPALPNGIATALTIAALVTAVALVVQRLASRDTRVLSRFQDYALPLLVAVPFASGFLVMHPIWSPFSRDFALLVHVLSADVLLFLIPLTKLNHMVLLPTTQLVSELAWHFPPDAGSKVAVTLDKVNEPI
jgi:nitrate reductase gamma subunit